MRERDQPMTQMMKASDARQHWSEVINAVARRRTRVLVEKSGVPVAAIISAQDLEELTRLEEQRRRDIETLARTAAAFEDVPVAELEAQVDAALAEVRAEERQARDATGA
jgi:prevent-host-death family protein